MWLGRLIGSGATRYHFGKYAKKTGLSYSSTIKSTVPLGENTRVVGKSSLETACETKTKSQG